jgi:hypothetical protein
VVKENGRGWHHHQPRPRRRSGGQGEDDRLSGQRKDRAKRSLALFFTSPSFSTPPMNDVLRTALLLRGSDPHA